MNGQGTNPNVYCTCGDFVQYEGAWWCWRDPEYPGPRPELTERQRYLAEVFAEAGREDDDA